MLVTWEHKELIGLRGEKWRGPERRGQDLSECSQFQQQQVRMLFDKMFVKSFFLLLQLHHVLFLLRAFPDGFKRWVAQTVSPFFVNYLSQSYMQEKGQSCGRHNLTRCAVRRNMPNLCTTEELTKDRRLNLWLHLEYELWQQDWVHRVSRAHYALYMQLIKQCKQSSPQPQQTRTHSPLAMEARRSQIKI